MVRAALRCRVLRSKWQGRNRHHSCLFMKGTDEQKRNNRRQNRSGGVSVSGAGERGPGGAAVPSEAPQTQTQEGERGQQAEGYFGMGKSHLSSGTQGSWVWIRMQGTGTG